MAPPKPFILFKKQSHYRHLRLLLLELRLENQTYHFLTLDTIPASSLLQ